MLNTVLFDMGGTLEDIWNTQETQAKAMDALQKTLQAHGLEPGCSPEEFDRRVMAGLKEYKRWSEGLELEKKPEEKKEVIPEANRHRSGMSLAEYRKRYGSSVC